MRGVYSLGVQLMCITMKNDFHADTTLYLSRDSTKKVQNHFEVLS